MSARLERPWGLPSLLYYGYWVCFPGVKPPGRGVNHLPPSSAEVEVRVDISLWVFMAFSRVNFVFFVSVMGVQPFYGEAATRGCRQVPGPHVDK